MTIKHFNNDFSYGGTAPQKWSLLSGDFCTNHRKNFFLGVFLYNQIPYTLKKILTYFSVYVFFKEKNG